MSPRLITQLVDDSPKILLIGDENSLKRKFSAFLNRQGLDVNTLPSLFNQEYQSIIQSKEFYKIIVIGSGEDLKKNLSYLKQNKNVLVINLVSSIEDNQYISSQSHLIIGHDIIPEGEKWSFFNFVTSKISQGIILDPQIKVFLLSEESFFNTIKNHLLSPQKQRLIVRGKQHNSDVVITEILRLLSLFKPDKKFIIKSEIVKSLNNQFSGFDEVATQPEALPSLLEESVRNLKIFELNHQTLKQEKKIFHDQELKEPELKPRKIEKKVVQEEVIENQPEIVNLLDQNEINTVSEIKPNLDLKEKPILNYLEPVYSQKKLNVDDQLNQIFKVKRVEEKVEKVKHIVKTTKQISKSTKKKKLLFVFGIVFTIIASTMLISAGFFWFTTQNLQKELTAVFLNFSSKDEYDTNYQKIENQANLLEKQIEFFEQIVPPEVFIDSRNIIEISHKISEYDQYEKEFNSDIEKLVSSFLGKDLLEDVLSAQKQSKTAQAYYETVTRLLSRLNDFKETLEDNDRKEKVEEFISYLDTQKINLRTYQQLSPVFDLLLGKDGKKTYAIVFQNNQELRPTGGFVQSIALITVDQGMLVDFQVYSSYELDKQLGGAVVPPDDIIRLLGENKWYLRDSNWDPDFTKSAQQMSWFIEQEVNKQIDGVIGINLFVLENILKEMGPLELDEYNEIITDKNIYERAEFHSEIKLVDSSEVEDYQTNLLKYLIRDLMIKGQENPTGLLSSLAKSIEEKQMTVYMKNQDLAQSFSLLGWSGELVKPQCPNQLSALECQVDALIINEANIGINKANYHTTRKDSHVIDIKEDQAKHTRVIKLDNTAFSNAWPKGGYKAYFRMYLPEDLLSLSIKIDGETIDENNYKIIKENNLNLVGILVETPIKTEKIVEINYVMPIEMPLPFSYVFFNQKQPGTDGILPEVIIKHDPDLSPTLIAPQAKVQGNSIIFSNLDEDHAFVGVSFE
ncbi:MAG: DUF4012 domain-containing protein [Candidatus Pacebacteria bacterium]|nr:DUF4012 domain-containing protein [Candidatus Paceibacterota bacterium]